MALLVTDDITESGVSIYRDKCATVQHISYECRRRRNGAGFPFGSTLPSYLDFTIKVSPGNNGKVFFDRMQQDKTFPFSFLYNAEFQAESQGSTNLVLSKYVAAMVATGYIVDAEESYENIQLGATSVDQMQIHVRLLLSKITYPGGDNPLYLTITQD